ncbi:MAG: DEAD/DEAH box helicase [Candidatus Woesearchaeota archaeon]
MASATAQGMEYKGLKLDRFQEEAIQAIDKNHSVVVSAPTGSGKTLIADYIIDRDIREGIRVIYTAPIKALSNQKYNDFVSDYGKDKVGLLTGDIVINPEAQILVMTTEVYRNMALTNDKPIASVSYVILDEIHYINDIERGYVWEESIIFSQDNVRFLCLSATIPNAKEFASWIQSIKNHNVDTVLHNERNVPLHKRFYDTELGITTLEEIRSVRDLPARGRGKRRRPRISPPNHIHLISGITDKLPCFFFNFSRKGCQQLALELARSKMFDRDHTIMSFVRKRLEGASKEIQSLKSTKMLRETLPYGIAFHHAGLIPLMKGIVEELFARGKIRVLYTTETFAVGMNMPAKTVCFKSPRKFDGVNFRFLNSKEYFQIAGRAGRRGIDKEGFVYMMVDRRDFNYDILKRITSKDIEPIMSQFRLSVNTVLNITDQHTPEEIESILRMSFYTYQHRQKSEIRNSFRKIRKNLERLGYIKDGRLTRKGRFSSKIYADEIMTGEIFATDLYKQLDDYQMMMVIASLCYEPREKTEFYKKYPSGEISDLKRKLFQHKGMKNRFSHLLPLTALVNPCYNGSRILEILKNTNLLEGDLIRFFRQMMDRFSQIQHATDDTQLRQKARDCQNIIMRCLSDIDSLVEEEISETGGDGQEI